MTAHFKWGTKRCTVHSKLLPRYLFLAGPSTLEIDGERVLQVDGKGFFGEGETTIKDSDGNNYHLHLYVHTKLLNLGYGVRVNGEEISSGAVDPENMFGAMVVGGFLGIAAAGSLIALGVW